MNQKQRDYFIGRIRQERDRKLADFPTHVAGPYWGTTSDDLKAVAQSIQKWAASVWPHLDIEVSQFNAAEYCAYTQGSISFKVGPGRDTKVAIRDSGSNDSVRRQIVAEAKRTQDAIMLGDSQEALRALEDFASKDFKEAK